MISINNLSKSFKVSTKEPGIKAAFKALIKKDFIIKHALKNISLEIKSGEILGLIGSNGAGKTTLVKILSGIISKDSGDVSVIGHDPWKREFSFRHSLSLIMGQKAQLWWDLPASDGFLLLKEIFQIDDKRFKENIKNLSERLNVEEQLKTPVRKLSLGERMKVELIAALLHDPKVIFLDEPTIGLDISSQKTIRSFLKEYRELKSPTIILTSHYMKDIEELCERVALMRSGEIIYDGSLDQIKEKYASESILSFDSLDEKTTKTILNNYNFTQSQKRFEIRLKKEEVPRLLSQVLNSSRIENLETREIDIETIIDNYLST